MPDKIAIVGGGPAGVSCAVQLKRSGLSPVIYEKEEVGGLIREAHFVENYPGFPDGISGFSIASSLRKMVDTWDIEVIAEEITELSLEEPEIRIRGRTTDALHRTAIIATGTGPRRLEGVDVAENAEARICYDPLRCKELQPDITGIIGDGDVAFDYALNLADTSEVHIFSRHSEPRALNLLKKRAAEKGIHIHREVNLEQVFMDGNSLVLKFDRTQMSVSALLPAMGRVPQLDFLAPELTRESRRYRESGQLYFIGDAVNGSFRQVTIACGDGVRAAMEIFSKWIL